ncbi:hypothetical protein D9M72_578860 [compost metagenome]
MSTQCSTPVSASMARWSAFCAWSKPGQPAPGSRMKSRSPENWRTSLPRSSATTTGEPPPAPCTCSSARSNKVPTPFCWSTAMAWWNTSTRASPRSPNIPPKKCTVSGCQNYRPWRTSANCCSMHLRRWPRATVGKVNSRAAGKTSNPTGANCRSPRFTATTAS